MSGAVLLDRAACILAVPALLAAGYLAALSLLSFWPLRRRSGQQAILAVIVPAHDEERGIERTVKSLLAADYPRDRFSVLVVADNCSDGTAQVARAAGAAVLVRDEPELRGKGYALKLAFDHLLLQGLADAAVVIDADSVVSRDLLRAFAGRIEEGEAGVQADYVVSNDGASWRTRLLAVALAAFHCLRSRGREALGVSAGIRGNGWCVATRVLREAPYGAFSRVEDVEYGVSLAELGHRIAFAAEAAVYSEMVPDGPGSRSQRQRWEEGRRELVKRNGRRLFAQALRQRSGLLLETAIDLLVPPLATLGLAVGLGMAASAVLWACSGRGQGLVVWSACALFLVFYVGRGWGLSGTGWRGLAGLAYAPVYLGWKLMLRLRRGSPDREWIRTARSEPRHDP